MLEEGCSGISSKTTLRGMDKGRNCLCVGGILKVSPAPTTPIRILIVHIQEQIRGNPDIRRIL